MPPLRNAHLAAIPIEQLRDYLLEANHPVNGGKAPFFNSMGYFKDQWSAMAEDLRVQHLVLEAIPGKVNFEGQTYRVEGELCGPLRAANIRSIWQIDVGATFPKFVLAYPIRDEDHENQV